MWGRTESPTPGESLMSKNKKAKRNDAGRENHAGGVLETLVDAALFIPAMVVDTSATVVKETAKACGKVACKTVEVTCDVAKSAVECIGDVLS